MKLPHPLTGEMFPSPVPPGTGWLDDPLTPDTPVAEAGTVVGVAGTVTTVAAGVLGLREYDREATHHCVLRLVGIDELTESLLTMTTAERLTLPYLHPGRADVIGAGALVLDRVLRRTTVETMLVSEADILDGIAWSVA